MTGLHPRAARLFSHAERLAGIAGGLRLSWSALISVVSGRVHERGRSEHITPLSSTIDRAAREIEVTGRDISRLLAQLDRR